MDDRVAKALLENNILDRQKRAEADIALLQKLATNPSLVLETLPNPTVIGNPNCCVYRPVPLAMLQSLFTTGNGVGNIVHDAVAGIAYTLNILSTAVVWVEWNDGLTSTQYQAVNIIFMTPNGAVYAVRAYDVHANSFIARAPGVGQPFEIILGPSDIAALLSSDYGLGGIYYNPNEPEEVMFVLTRAGSNTIKFFIGANGTWTAGHTINGAASTNASMRFGTLTDHWIVNIGGIIYTMPADVSSVISSYAAGSYTMGSMSRSPSGYTYFFPDDTNKINFATGDGAVFTRDDSNKSSNRITSEATGLYLMADDSTRGIRSSDGGYIWENIPGLPLGNYEFVWIGGEGAASQWIAVGGQYVYYSADFGDTWSDKIGDLTDIVAVPDLNLACNFGTVEKVCSDGDQTEALVISISDIDPLSVHITGGLYQGQDGWSFSSTTDPDLSIASHIPGFEVRIVGFQSNDTTGEFTIVDGPIFNESHIPTKNDFPAADAGNTMLFFLELYAGEMGICDDDFIVPSPTPVDQTKLKVGYQIDNAPADTPLDADKWGFWDVVDNALKSITWANIKATLKTYFDTLYAVIGHTHTTEVSDDAYNATTWDGVTTIAPSKNVIRDKFVSLTQDDIPDGTTYKQYSATEETKLAGIEAGADVTDAGNVGTAIDGAASATIADTDKVPFIKSSVLKWELWVNLKSTIISLITATKLDDFATPDDNTDLNANTTNHGLLLKATAPAANVLNVVGIANGETAYTNKAIFDGTNPANIGTAAPGTSLIAAHRDHVHAIAASDLPSGIDAAKISAGNVSNTEFDYLNGVTSAIQTQLDGKREKVTGSVTYYVRTDGSDSNDGLTDSSGGAFLTIQHALDVIKSYDWSGFFVTIQIGAGTFAETLSINGFQYVGLGGLTITGTLTTLDTLTNGVGAVQGSGATQGTIVRNAGSWTLNQRQNKICRFTSGVNNGLSRIIDSNIAGATATIVGGWASGAPANGDTFVVEDWGTIIRSLALSNGISVTLNNLRFGDGSSALNGLSVSTKAVVGLNRCWINQSPNTSVNGFLITGYSAGSIADSYIDGGVTVAGDFPIQMQGSRVSYTRCKIFNPSKTKGRGIWSNGQCGGFITGCVIDGGIVGIYVTGATPYTLLASIVNHVIRNCATGVQADTQASVTGTANVTYSGNTADESATAASYGYID